MSKINIKNVKGKFAAVALAGSLTLGALTLTSCNKNVFDTEYTFDKAITVNDGVATIYDVKKWSDYEDGEQIQLILEDGTVVLTSAFDTKLFKMSDSDKSIEEIAASLVGPEGYVVYFGETIPVKSK